MKVHILFNGELVVDVWRHENGKALSLAHEIDPSEGVRAKAHAARVMRQQLRDRGDDVPEIDAALNSASANQSITPARQAEILTEVVYAMGELLCPPGQEVFEVELGKGGN